MAHYETKAYPMIPLLEHELIKKYFEFNDDGHEIATRVIRAMSEPIRKGNRYLSLGFDGGGQPIILEVINDGELTGFGCMRLPDQWQCRCSQQDICRVHPEMAANQFQPRREPCCEYEKYFAMTTDGSYAKLCEEHFAVIRNAVKKPVLLDEKIHETASLFHGVGFTHSEIVSELRKLVDLARTERG